jgi:indole-3-glycerol phosphate synthase
MTQKTDTILDRIVADKRVELAAAASSVTLAELRAQAGNAPAVRPFVSALKGTRVTLIAEVKKASPSRGLLRAYFDPVAIARAYADAGAAAISVLTDEKHFQGSLADLRLIRDALPHGPPLLRKDFLFDKYQVYEARCVGADAVLLICAILEPQLFQELMDCAEKLGMDVLVEVHDEKELRVALSAGAQLIGINNRDLRTFEVDLATTERLAPLVPDGTTVVAESGISTRVDVRRLEACGVGAVLIGEALITADDAGAKIRELFG